MIMKKKDYLEAAQVSLKEKYPKLSDKFDKVKEQQESCLKLFKWILLGDPLKRIYEYHFFMNGILTKTLNLSESFVTDLFFQNSYSLNMILRAHYESLAALHYYQKYPQEREKVAWGDKYKDKKGDWKIEAVHISKMLRELDKDTPDWMKVMEDYEEMSQIVHPNRKSHLANIKPKEENSFGHKIFSFSSSPELYEQEVEMYLNAQITLVDQIIINLKLFDDNFCKANNIQKEMPKLMEEKNEN